MDCGPAGGDPETEINSFPGFLSLFPPASSKFQLFSLLLFTIFLLNFIPLFTLSLIGCVVVDRWFQGTNPLRTHYDPDPNSHHHYQHGLFFLSSSHHQKHPVQIMAILESEKRPRGLRVPSFSSIKSFGKKGSEAQQQQQYQQKMDSLPEALPPPPPDKQLPSVPTSVSPQAAPAAPVAAPTPMRLPAASATDLNFGLDAAPMADFGTDRYPMPTGANRSTPNISNGNGNGISHSNGNGSLAVPPPPVQRTPSNGSQRTATSDGEPLEDYIPEPEPEPEPEAIDHMHADISPGLEPVPDVEHTNMDDVWTPPGYEPVAAPLNKLHFACYQEHRSMPPAANVWHALPCMTCQKFDREVRHRCVFCCLRICEDCYQNLQKCSRRSLDELLSMIQS